MEAAGEGGGLVPFSDKAEFPGTGGVLGAHVLDVDLASFEAEFDLHLASLCSDPHVHLPPVVQ